MFSMRIVSTDYYMAEPIPGLDMVYSEFRQTAIQRVPVIHIFGPTTSGQKTCLSVHGVFPYLYAAYDGTLPVGHYLQQFATSLDKAINISQGKASSTFQHVYKVSLVSGIPFYGYHAEEQAFLKIYLYKPNLIKKVADLLLAGAVMNRVIQPHESHIPYVLQMFIDYNLFGMNLVNAAAVKFRRPLPSDSNVMKSGETDKSLGETSSLSLGKASKKSGDHSADIWTVATIPQESLLPSDVERLSTCELEVDVVAADIINRLDVTGDKLGANPGLVALWEDEQLRRMNRNLSSVLAPPESQDRCLEIQTSKELQMKQQLGEVLRSLDPYVISSRNSLDLNQSTMDSPLEDTLIQASESTASNLLRCSGELDVVLPVVDESSILQVVSSSQNFAKNSNIEAYSSQLLNTSLDRSLLNILASLADMSEFASSQSQTSLSSGSVNLRQLLSQVTALEDRDSLLSQIASSNQEICDIEEQEAKENLEMSQALDDNLFEDSVEASGAQQQQQQQQLLPHLKKEDFGQKSSAAYNLEGINKRWEANLQKLSSDAKPKEEEEEEEDYDVTLPQLDGPTGRKKRLRPQCFRSEDDIRNDRLQPSDSAADCRILKPPKQEGIICRRKRRLIGSDEPNNLTNIKTRRSHMSLDMACNSEGINGKGPYNPSSLSEKLVLISNNEEEEVDEKASSCNVQSSKISGRSRYNTRKRFKTVRDQFCTKDFSNVIQEVSVKIEKLHLNCSRVRVVSRIVDGTERFTFHPVEKVATIDTSRGDSSCHSGRSEPTVTTHANQLNEGVGEEEEKAMYYSEGVDNDSGVKYLDVLSKFALLSSPDSSDLDSEGPTASSPTQEVGHLSLNFSDQTVVVDEEFGRTVEGTESSVYAKDLSKNSSSSLTTVISHDNSVGIVSDELNAEVGKEVSSPSSALHHMTGLFAATNQNSQNSETSRDIRQGDVLGDRSHSEGETRSVDLFSETSFKSSQSKPGHEGPAVKNIETISGKNVENVDEKFSSSGSLMDDGENCLALSLVDKSKATQRSKRFDLEQDRIVAIRPQLDPPSRDQVAKEMLLDSFPLRKPNDAFYSNPEDLPSRLRFEEAHVTTKVKSPLVCDLPEHTAYQGLKYWQSKVIGRELSTLGHSQVTTEDILRQTTVQPSLYNMLVRDKRVVVTPCKLPPPSSVVREWVSAKRHVIKKKEKNQAVVSKEEEKVATGYLTKADEPSADSISTCNQLVDLVTKGKRTRGSSPLSEGNKTQPRLRCNLPQSDGIHNISKVELSSCSGRRGAQPVSKESSIPGKMSILVSPSSNPTAGIPKASSIELEIPNVMLFNHTKKKKVPTATLR